MKLLTVVSSLKQARDAAKREYEKLDAALKALNGGPSSGRVGRVLSADARERIAEAQRKRWAQFKKQQRKVK